MECETIKTIELVCQVGNDSLFTLPEHAHNGYQLIYVRQGTVHMDIGGTSYQITGKSLVFISNFEQHSISEVFGVYDRIYVNLAPDYVESVLQNRQLLSVFCNRPKGYSHVIPLGDEPGEVDTLFIKLTEEYRKKTVYWEDLCGLELKRLLILLYRMAPEHFPSEVNSIRNIIWDVKTYIEENAEKPLIIREIASRFHISSFYLSHAFKQVTGYSPKQYLMQYRLTVARRLLLTTQDKVGNIALQTGFGDASNFTRTFRESTGMTPQEYRTRSGYVAI